MTIFLALSALVNIGLGYGLAIYLGHARLPLGSRHTDEPAVDSFAAPFEEPSPQPVVAPAAPQISGPAAQVAPPSAPAEPAVPTTPTESAELETDVLAGIEEFRNQLAQMKAQPALAESATPQPAGA